MANRMIGILMEELSNRERKWWLMRNAAAQIRLHKRPHCVCKDWVLGCRGAVWRYYMSSSPSVRRCSHYCIRPLQLLQLPVKENIFCIFLPLTYKEIAMTQNEENKVNQVIFCTRMMSLQTRVLTTPHIKFARFFGKGEVRKTAVIRLTLMTCRSVHT